MPTAKNSMVISEHTHHVLATLAKMWSMTVDSLILHLYETSSEITPSLRETLAQQYEKAQTMRAKRHAEQREKVIEEEEEETVTL